MIQRQLAKTRCGWLTSFDSICLICAVRIKYILEIDASDETYSLPLFGIFAALEPLLGIINACLPVLPPALKKFWNNSAFASNPSSKSFPGYFKGSSWRPPPDRMNHGGSERFQRIDDLEYPLVEVPQRTHRAKASSSSMPGSPISNQREIRVTKGWRIDSSSDTDHAT